MFNSGGFFNPFVNSCEHERNMDWILNRIKDLPQKSEIDKLVRLMEEANKNVERINRLIGSAVTVAEENLRAELGLLYRESVKARNEATEKAEEVTQIVEDATNTVYDTCREMLNAEYAKVTTKYEETKNYIENAKNDITARCDTALSEVVEELKQENEENMLEHVRRIEAQNVELYESKCTELEQRVDDSLNTVTNDVTNNVSSTIPGKITVALAARLVRFRVTIPASSWVDSTARITVDTVLSGDDIFVSPLPDNFMLWYESGIYLYGVSDSTLIFKCVFAPSADVTVHCAAVR